MFNFIFNQIPPIPKKQMFDNLNEVVLSKRRRFFQKFLDHLIAMPVVKASHLFYDFLTIKEETYFNKKKAEYEMTEGVHKLKDTINLEGILYSKFSKDLSKQQKVLRDYVNYNEILLGKLTAQYDVLKLDFEKISSTLNNISDLYKQLYETSDEYVDPFSMTNTYSTLRDLNKEWSKSYKKQIQVNEEDFKEFFDYYRCELEAIKEHITTYEENKQDYLRYYNTLKHKKEKLFKLGNPAKWELTDEDSANLDKSRIEDKHYAFSLMCKKDAKTVEDKRRQLGVICHNLQSDFLKMRSYHSRRYEKHFSDIAGKNKEVLSDVFNLVKILHMNSELEKKRRESNLEKQNKTSTYDTFEASNGQENLDEKIKLDDLDENYARHNTICKKSPKESLDATNRLSVEYIRIEKHDLEGFNDFKEKEKEVGKPECHFEAREEENEEKIEEESLFEEKPQN